MDPLPSGRQISAHSARRRRYRRESGGEESNVNFDHPSRRTVIGGALALRAAQRASAQSAGVLTADLVIERIRQNVGVPWRTQTVDNIVLGDGASAVKGIATTMMATFDVVKRCVDAGMNLLI